MAAYTQEGAAARSRVLGIMRKLVRAVPDQVMEYVDWDELANRHTVPWTDEEMSESTSMTKDEYDRVWGEFELQRQLGAGNEEAQRIANEARLLEEATDRAGIPGRYRNTPLLLTYEEDLEAGCDVYIRGAQGSGKTFEACAMLRGWLSRNRGTARFATSVGIITEITATYDSTDTVLGVVDKYGRCPLLVIDDIGKENPTRHALEMLWHVLNMRYSWGVPTIYTSQYTLGELGNRLASNGDYETAGSIVSRISEQCVVHDMGDIDRRLANSFQR